MVLFENYSLSHSIYTNGMIRAMCPVHSGELLVAMENLRFAVLVYK